MTNESEPAELNFHRVSAFVFGEMWPELEREFLHNANPLKRFSTYRDGISICDMVLFSERRDSKQIRLLTHIIGRSDLDVTFWIIGRAPDMLRKLFSKKTKALNRSPKAKGAEMTFLMLLEADRDSATGSYWDRVEFREFFEERYDLPIETVKDLNRFEDALKNRRRELRAAECKHNEVFEQLLVDLYVDIQAQRSGEAAADQLREHLKSERSEKLVAMLRETHQEVISPASIRRFGLLGSLAGVPADRIQEFRQVFWGVQ